MLAVAQSLANVGKVNRFVYFGKGASPWFDGYFGDFIFVILKTIPRASEPGDNFLFLVFTALKSWCPFAAGAGPGNRLQFAPGLHMCSARR